MQCNISTPPNNIGVHSAFRWDGHLMLPNFFFLKIFSDKNALYDFLIPSMISNKYIGLPVNIYDFLLYDFL